MQVRSKNRVLALSVLLPSLFLPGTGCAAPREAPPAAVETSPEAWMAERGAKEARQERIEAELATLGEEHPWAGRYTCGDGYGVNVRISIAPDGGFTYQWRGSTDLVDLNHGEIVELGDRHLRFEYVLEPSDRTWIREARIERRFLAEEWYVVDWGSVRMLVPATQMVAFCNDVNDGASMHDSPYCWRHNPGEGSRHLFEFIELPTTRPVIPEEFERYLLDEPLDGVITEVGDPVLVTELRGEQDELEVRMRVDLGATRGLLPGMILHFYATRLRGELLVVEVGAEDATVVHRFLAEPKLVSWNCPRVGWEVSTLRQW